MRRFFFGLFAVTVFAISLPVPLFAQSAAVAERAATIDPAKLTGVVDWLKADVATGRIPGAVVLVARDGKIAAA